MKLHPIFSQQFYIWWLALAFVTAIKVYFWGLDPDFVKANGDEKHGLLFWVIGLLLTALIFSMPIYLLYRVIFKKSNNKVFMGIISLLVGALLIYL